jgi:hypothetical protein
VTDLAWQQSIDADGALAAADLPVVVVTPAPQLVPGIDRARMERTSARGRPMPAHASGSQSLCGVTDTELPVGVGAPAEQPLRRVDGTRMAASCGDGDPAAADPDLFGRKAPGRRTVAELAVGVVAPAPQRRVAADGAGVVRAHVDTAPDDVGTRHLRHLRAGLGCERRARTQGERCRRGQNRTPAGVCVHSRVLQLRAIRAAAGIAIPARRRRWTLR